MNKAIKMFLITIPIVILTIVVVVFCVQKYKVFEINKKVEETVVVGDKQNIKDIEQIFIYSSTKYENSTFPFNTYDKFRTIIVPEEPRKIDDIEL